MKFSFCGDQSVPEWFLSQLNLLSNLSFVKLRKIAGLYMNHLASPSDPSFMEQILEVLVSSEFSENESRTIVAMIDFILSNSAKNDIEQETLMKELIDLGIPKENCQSICKILDQNHDKIRASLKEKVLRVNRFETVAFKKWNVIASSDRGKGGEYYRMNMTVKLSDDDTKGFAMCLDKTQLTRLADDMAAVMRILQRQEE